jgi:hypothetical protein
MQVSDLPRDPLGALSSIRSKLASLVNSSKHSGTKRALLIETLECAIAELKTQGAEEVIIDDIIAAVEKTVDLISDPLLNLEIIKRATAKVNKDDII